MPGHGRSSLEGRAFEGAQWMWRRWYRRAISVLLAGGLSSAAVTAQASGAPPGAPPPPPEATCVTIQRGALGSVGDADVSPNNGTWAAGQYPFMWTGALPDVHWAVYQFDLASIPAGAQVVLGVFATYVVWNETSSTVRAHRILTPWDEATVTWQGFGGASSWSPDVVGSFDPVGVGQKSIDVTALVQSWVGGVSPNHGLLLEEDPGKLHGYFTSEANGASLRPSLYVCYLAGGMCAGAADGTPCEDGNACSIGETCQNGQCAGGSTVTCDPLDACHEAGICDPATGICSDPPKAEGTPCNDGDACTANDVCILGACSGDFISCDDQDACTADACDLALGCSHTPASCDDGDACTVDTCDSALGCWHAPSTCAASDSCHEAGTCDSVTGQCSSPAKPDGAACSDGDACTQGDTCQAGQCVPGPPATCAPVDQCHTAGACDAATGQCSSPVNPDGAACSDGDSCTQNDTCQSGQCTGGPAVLCPSGDACHAQGVCDPSTGQCSNPPSPDGTSCGTNAACKSGVCTQASLLIKVFDEEGYPIQGAEVSAGNQTISTDVLGHALLAPVVASAVVAEVHAAGRATAVVLRAVHAGGSLDESVTLARLGEPIAIDPATGGAAVRGNVRVELASGAVVRPNQTPVTSPYGVTILSIDPATDAVGAIPAPLEGLLEDGTPTALASVFMTEISLWDEGQPLAIANGHTATLELTLPDDMQYAFSVGQTLDAWWLDTSIGKWRREGNGVLVPSSADPSRLAWVGEVGHFTWWNIGPAIAQRNCVNVTIQGGGGNASIRSMGIDYDTSAPGDQSTVTLFATPSGGAVNSACIDMKKDGIARITVEEDGYYIASASLDPNVPVPGYVLLNSDGAAVIQGNNQTTTGCGDPASSECAELLVTLAPLTCVGGKVMNGPSAMVSTVLARYTQGARTVSTLTTSGVNGTFCLEVPHQAANLKVSAYTATDLRSTEYQVASWPQPNSYCSDQPQSCNELPSSMELSSQEGLVSNIDLKDSTGNQRVGGIAATSNGDTILVGHFDGSGAVGGTPLESLGGRDVFLLRMSPANEVLWANVLRGTQLQQATAVAVDELDNVYVSGFFNGMMEIQNVNWDNGTTYTTYAQHTSAGLSDGFIAKFGGDGTHLWSAALRGAGNQYVQDIALAPNGDGTTDIVGVGEFASTLGFSFASAMAAESQTPSVGGQDQNFCGACLPTGCPTQCTATAIDAFVVRIRPGGTPRWGWVPKAAGTQRALAVATAASGNTYVTGEFLGSLPLGIETLTANVDQFYDAFVVGLDQDGGVVWGYRIGELKNQRGTAIATGATYAGPIGPENGVVIGGEFSGRIPNPFAAEPAQPPNFDSFGSDAFLLMLSEDDGQPVAIKPLGANKSSLRITSLLASDENLYVAGSATELQALGVNRLGTEDLYFGHLIVDASPGQRTWNSGQFEKRIGNLAGGTLGSGLVIEAKMVMSQGLLRFASTLSSPLFGSSFFVRDINQVDKPFVSNQSTGYNLLLFNVNP